MGHKQTVGMSGKQASKQAFINGRYQASTPTALLDVTE